MSPIVLFEVSLFVSITRVQFSFGQGFMHPKMSWKLLYSWRWLELLIFLPQAPERDCWCGPPCGFSHAGEKTDWAASHPRFYTLNFELGWSLRETDLDFYILGDSIPLCSYLMSGRKGCQLFHWTWCYGNVPAAQTSADLPLFLGGLLVSDSPILLGLSQSAESLSCSNTMETRNVIHQIREM